MEQVLWFLTGLGLGLLLDWVLVKVMLRSVKERVLALELVLDWEKVRVREQCRCNNEEIRQ
jgi:hypothetical protein